MRCTARSVSRGCAGHRRLAMTLARARPWPRRSYPTKTLGLIQGEGWLFRGLDLYIGERDRLALIGRNGAGKTTLLKCLAGLIDTDEGKRTIVPGTNVVLLEQDPKMDGFATLAGLGASRRRCARARMRPTAIADQLGIDLSRPVATASGGERRRAAIARALAQNARRAAARRADQPSRPRRDRVARGVAQALHRRLHRHQPRPHVPDPPDAKLHLARSRRAAPRGDRLRRVRGVDRAGL